MTIEAAIFDRLKAISGVTALVGAGDAARVYPGMIPQRMLTNGANNAYPAIVIQRIDSIHERHLDGGSGIAHPRVQITSWSRDYSELKTLSEAIREGMDNAAGVQWGASGEEIEVRLCALQNQNDIIQADGDGSDLPVFGVAMDFIIWHEESVT